MFPMQVPAAATRFSGIDPWLSPSRSIRSARFTPEIAHWSNGSSAPGAVISDHLATDKPGDAEAVIGPVDWEADHFHIFVARSVSESQI